MKRLNRVIILMIIMALVVPYTASAAGIGDHEIIFDKILNARDMGGYKTKQGTRVKKGVLIRSGELSYASKNDLKKIKSKYKVKRIVDFRYEPDSKYCPDKKVSGAKNIVIPAKYNSSPSKSSPKNRYRRLRYKSKKKLRSAAIPTFGRADRSYTDSLVNSSYSKKQYKKYFKQLLANKNGNGVLIHCIYGKDRTGVAAFMTLVALGVDEETAYKEYSLTNAYLKKYGKKAYNNYSLGVRERDLRYAVKKAKKEYGSLNNFLKKAYGLDSKKLKQLRKIYTE